MKLNEALGHIKFKFDKDDRPMFFELHFLLHMVIVDMAAWCKKRNIDFVITDTVSSVEEDAILGRVSSSHRERRAIDLRSWTFDPKYRKKFITHFNRKYRDIASISKRDLKPRLVVWHGNPKHFHIAINAKYAIKE